MGRMLLLGLIVVLVVLLLLFLLGPRVGADTTIRFDPAAIGDDLDAYLAAGEARFDDIRPGLEKRIVWADAQKRRTPIALVYVHGFSASSGELAPVPERVAARLGANLFLTRLAGHGRTGAALAEASVNDWINDYAEAVAIGRRIGEDVVVMATSTGGGLATWAAAQPELAEDVDGLVLVSPNYGLQADGAWLLTMPWGGMLAELALGPERGFEPLNEEHARLWTTRYPTRALLPMAAVTELAAATPVEDIRIPALFIYSPDDAIVRPGLIEERIARWGAETEVLVVDESGDPSSHVLAGDALSPSTNEMVVERVTGWIKAR